MLSLLYEVLQYWCHPSYLKGGVEDRWMYDMSLTPKNTHRTDWEETSKTACVSWHFQSSDVNMLNISTKYCQLSSKYICVSICKDILVQPRVIAALWKTISIILLSICPILNPKILFPVMCKIWYKITCHSLIDEPYSLSVVKCTV